MESTYIVYKVEESGDKVLVHTSETEEKAFDYMLDKPDQHFCIERETALGKQVIFDGFI